MALLDELAAKIATLLPAGTLIKTGKLSPSTSACVAVYETGGAGADLGLGTPGIKYEYPSVQVVARGEPTDYAWPRALIQLVYLGLPKVQGATLSGVKYLTIRPAQPPFKLTEDPNQRVIIAVNFNIEKEPSQ